MSTLQRPTKRRYLAFDLEIAAQLPAGETDLLRHRPLGISCAGTMKDDESPQMWHGGASPGAPNPMMSREEVSLLVDFLLEAISQGFTILTWNGLGFDFDVLAEESDRWKDCRKLAYDHVDMMFHLHCAKGYPLSLDVAARGLGLPGKPPGLDGSMIPALWAKGQFSEVTDYLANDVQTTLQVAVIAEQNRRLTWYSQRGNPMEHPLSFGWLAVSAANRLPEPDTSWMSLPIPRSKFIGWLKV